MGKDLVSELLNSNIPDDKQIKAIDDLTPEELAEAIKILDEKIDGTSDDIEDTPSDESLETEEPDTSNDETGVKENEEPSEEVVIEDKDFVLTEDLISKQPEEDQKILNNYKNKSKDEVAQAVAHAIAVKSPYLKENKKIIGQLKEEFLEKSGDELIKILVDVQRNVGKPEQSTPQKPKYDKIELPDIPEEDPEIKKIIEKETLKLLKLKYPNMPDVDSMDSEEYKEFRRDLDIDNPDNEFKIDKSLAEKQIKEEFGKFIYIQKNLPNLYEESPEEVLPILTPENLPRLKALNDDPYGVLEEDLKKEIETIREGLKKYGLTEADLGVDLTITKDENGVPYNPIIEKLIIEGKDANGNYIPSPKIIGRRGKTFWLKQGELAKKFKEEYDDKILTEFVNKKTLGDRYRKEKLKSETLREASGRGAGSRKSVISVEDIEKASPTEIKRILAELERS